ncbi:MAG: CPBP family intramembrane metalloprotease [Candidatus Omnitrophica bacterium]|nr:CPBP family intramembrane metalloprotease [Candidatus Omnitrophota bacterium]
MKIKTRDWCIFTTLAVLLLFFWYKLEYPRFAFVNLSINKQQAITKSSEYLQSKGIEVKNYSRAIIFDEDEGFNRYFQHAAGLKAEEEFIEKHNFDLFRWMVRFFKESQKEEYYVYVSPRTGEVIRFFHLIEDIEPRIDLGKDNARFKAEAFLRETFNADLSNYDFHEEKAKRYEKRTDYVFSWEEKGVYIPWKENQGGAKLLTEVTVSGNEVREFNKHRFDLPEKFSRYVEKQFILGEYLFSIFYIILFAMLIFSVNIVLKKRQEVIPRLTKKWFYYVAAFLFVINSAELLNSLQIIFMDYPTSARMSSFLGLVFSKWLFNTGFLIIGFIMPGIAGETLSHEVFSKNKYSSFFTYIQSGFLNRGLTRSIILGYLICAIMMGVQAIAFYYGQKFLGVWREWSTMTYFSSGYIPLLTAFVIGAGASLNEEINFRLFGISFAKKYLRSSFLAVLLASVIWGMGHTLYAIFPVWFRIIEVSLIGLLYGFILIRFGIIPLIVAHYLFDVFWCSAAYLLGKSSPYLFYSSVGLLGIPLLLAVLAFFLNLPERDKPMAVVLDRIEKYNQKVLVAFVLAKKLEGSSIESIKTELIRHNWDHLLVDLAIKEVFNPDP